jgi:hypothetical protein
MSKVVNLRQARKARARADKRAAADANAIAHGESAAARSLRAARADRARRLLDGARRGDENDGRDRDEPNGRGEA